MTTRQGTTRATGSVEAEAARVAGGLGTSIKAGVAEAVAGTTMVGTAGEDIKDIKAIGVNGEERVEHRVRTECIFSNV